MEKKTEKSEAKTAYGKKLETPIKYEYSYSAYQTDEELVAAKDEMTLEEQRKTRNTERQSNARQKALQKALDDAKIVKPTAENDEQVRLMNTYKMLIVSRLPNGEKRYTEEQARVVASQVIGAEWATE